MNRLFILASLFGVLSTVYARQANMLLGGQGTLFPDHNSFANYGAFAQNKGFGLEGTFTKALQGTAMTGGASAVWGGKMFGIGAGGSMTLSAPMTQTVYGGLGVSMFKDKVSLGAGYTQNLQGGGLGTAKANLNFHSQGNMQGFSLGVAFGMSLAAPMTQSVTGAIGYGFKNMSKFAIEFTLPSLASFSNFVGGAYYTITTKWLYFGAGYNLIQAGTMSHAVMGRLGFIINALDISGFVYYPFVGATGIVGGSLRLSF